MKRIKELKNSHHWCEKLDGATLLDALSLSKARPLSLSKGSMDTLSRATGYYYKYEPYRAIPGITPIVIFCQSFSKLAPTVP